MKKTVTLLLFSLFCWVGFSQVVEAYGGGEVSPNTVMNKVDLKEIGRLIHVASVEDGKAVVRRFYRGKWEQIDETPITGINKLHSIELFAYRATPYLFCHYNDHMTVIRAINDKWEYVGEEKFGEGVINDPQFSVIGENPFIVYEDTDYEVLRMFYLLDNSWYDVDLMSTENLKSYKIGAKARGDLFIALLDDEGLTVKKIEQTQDPATWKALTKLHKLENVNAIDDFDFIENTAYVTYLNEINAPVIIQLEELEKKWVELENSKEAIDLGRKDYNLNISEYYFFTALSDKGIPQFLKNNKKGNWGNVTSLSDKKALCIASDAYKNVIYVAYVDAGSSKLIVKKIEKGLNENEDSQSSGKKKK